MIKQEEDLTVHVHIISEWERAMEELEEMLLEQQQLNRFDLG
jgi:hypothetical protein